MPITVFEAYEAILAQHRERLTRLTERGGIVRVKGLYDAAQADLEAKLARIARGERGASYNATHHHRVLDIIRDGQATLGQRMIYEINGAATEAQKEGLRVIARDIATMEKLVSGTDYVLPIEEAARFWGIVDQRKTSLLSMSQDSVARYTMGTVKVIEQQLALSLATGEPLFSATERVSAVMGSEWWRAERIVRTEVAWAYNAGQADSIADASKDIPDMGMRWCEHVDDATLRPMDNRVAADSVALHGQVAFPGQKFTMPNNERVDARSWGEQYDFPPNRPNDRATLSPWRSHWGISGWQLVGGQKVDAAIAAKARQVPRIGP